MDSHRAVVVSKFQVLQFLHRYDETTMPFSCHLSAISYRVWSVVLPASSSAGWSRDVPCNSDVGSVVSNSTLGGSSAPWSPFFDGDDGDRVHATDTLGLGSALIPSLKPPVLPAAALFLPMRAPRQRRTAMSANPPTDPTTAPTITLTSRPFSLSSSPLSSPSSLLSSPGVPLLSFVLVGPDDDPSVVIGLVLVDVIISNSDSVVVVTDSTTKRGIHVNKDPGR